MSPLIIVGADGFARQIEQIIKDINAVMPKWKLKGFLGGPSGKRVEKAGPYLGSFFDYQPHDKECFVCGLMLPQDKKIAVSLLKAKGGRFISVIHPTSNICSTSHCGEGVVLFPNSNISAYSKLGDFVTIICSGLGHDVVTGDYTSIGANCAIGGGAKLGCGVLLGPGAAITPRIEVGGGVVLDAGSVAIKNVPPDSHVAGNPARKKRPLN